MEDVKNFIHIKNKLPERIKGLYDLSMNLWWSWNPETRDLGNIISTPAWNRAHHNPLTFLSILPRDVFERCAQNPEFLRRYDYIYEKFKNYMSKKFLWFHEKTGLTESPKIIYLSAEYGIHHSLSIYAGGLGILAGDHVKESSDLGLPMVAIGFNYPKGYVRQKINADGWQEDVSDYVGDRPVAKVYKDSETPLILKIPILDTYVYTEVNKVMVGRVPLYLLDTNIEINEPWLRDISSNLYAGDIEQRLKQEIVLGLGSYLLLKELEIDYSVIHINEGHPAFVLLGQISEFLKETGNFDEAVEKTKEMVVFTTHTPVAAGHDKFPFPMMERYFKQAAEEFGIDLNLFFQLGLNPENPDEGFNMTAFAMRVSKHKNAVSKKHQEVTKIMWRHLWPDKSLEEIPVDYVTNGVHIPTWIHRELKKLYENNLDPELMEMHDSKVIWELVDDIPDDILWKTHKEAKQILFNYIREHIRRRWIEDKEDPSITVAEGVMLDPEVLTIAFARRFTAYKRPDLILHDLDRLKKIVNNDIRPVQIIFAGKAHPADIEGKRLIQKVFNVAKDPDFGGRIVFVEDYNQNLAKFLIRGVDVWLNNPIPPLEASGTSGMKASLNGVPNLSILDGWWLEGYNGKNGWIFGTDVDVSGEERNRLDAESLYNVLENEVVPMYYSVSSKGVPKDWVKVMKEAIKTVAPTFSARRMIKEYTEKFYMDILFEQMKKRKESV